MRETGRRMPRDGKIGRGGTGQEVKEHEKGGVTMGGGGSQERETEVEEEEV